MKMKPPINKKGFTLVELLVVIAIIGMLASIVLSSLNTARAKSRDSWRLQELVQLKTALELYYSKNNRYPSPSSDAGVYSCGGWDASADGTFIAQLVADGDLPNISDPNRDATCGNFAYYRYSPSASGCENRYFYVLGVRNFETITPTSPGWSCPGRNWQNEFSWVTGKYE